jgi:hypothetical protein
MVTDVDAWFGDLDRFADVPFMGEGASSRRCPRVRIGFGELSSRHQCRHRAAQKPRCQSGASGASHQLAAAYGLKGEIERSAAELAEARKLAVEGSFLSIAKMKVGTPSSTLPAIRDLVDATYFAGLSKAGMPEE